MNSHKRFVTLLLISTLSFVFASDILCAQAQKYYTKQDTWLETLIAWHMAYAQRPQATAAPAPMPDFGASDFTIMAWIRTEEDGTIMAKCPPKGSWAAQGKTFFVSGGRLAMDIGWVGAIGGNKRIADNKWHHVALTGGKNEFTFYVDGAKDADEMLAAKSDVESHVVKIGYTNDNFPGSSAFEGDLDEVRLYHKKLTAKQIEACYKDPTSAPTVALAGYWPFDTDGTDASGSNNHAVKMAGAKIAEGKIGKALSLNGKGQVLLPSSGEVDLADSAWLLLEKDFTDKDSLEQMEWTRNDSIWDRKWDAGDFEDIFTRYAEATTKPEAFAKQANELAANLENRQQAIEILTLYYNSKRHEQLDKIL